MEFETLGGKAECRLLRGSAFPDASVSVLCMQNASLPKDEKNRGPGKCRQHVGLPPGVGADETPVWTMWVCVETGRNGGAGYGHGV